MFLLRFFFGLFHNRTCVIHLPFCPQQQDFDLKHQSHMTGGDGSQGTDLSPHSPVLGVFELSPTNDLFWSCWSPARVPPPASWGEGTQSSTESGATQLLHLNATLSPLGQTGLFLSCSAPPKLLPRLCTSPLSCLVSLRATSGRLESRSRFCVLPRSGVSTGELHRLERPWSS